MKKLFSLLLALCLLCASVTALASTTIDLKNLNWKPTDDEHVKLSDEVMEELTNALKEYHDGEVEPFLVLYTKQATDSLEDSDMSDENKTKLQDSLNELLSTLGAGANVLIATYVHGEDACILCRVTPNDTTKEMFWILAYVSHKGELLHVEVLNPEYTE